jgi:hypothetical protein
VSAYESDVHSTAMVGNLGYEPIIVAPYSENDAIVTQDAGVWELVPDLGRGGPVGLPGDPAPFPQRLLGVWVAPPEIAQCIFGEDSHSR